MVLGPKIGLFLSRAELKDPTFTESIDGTGFAAGINAGLFLPVTPATSLGVLGFFEIKELENACVNVTDQSGFQTGICDSTPNAPTSTVVGLSAAALF